MSWTTYKAEIETVLKSKGLREIPENKTTEQTAMSHNHNSYSLKYGGIAENSVLVSKGLLKVHLAQIEIKYLNIDSSKRAINADSFNTVIDALIGMSNFLGFQDLTFEDIDNKHSVGKISVLVGVDGSC